MTELPDTLRAKDAARALAQREAELWQERAMCALDRVSELERAGKDLLAVIEPSGLMSKDYGLHWFKPHVKKFQDTLWERLK